MMQWSALAARSNRAASYPRSGYLTASPHVNHQNITHCPALDSSERTTRWVPAASEPSHLLTGDNQSTVVERLVVARDV